MIADGISGVLPQGNTLAGVIAYCVGMALFTMTMGNVPAAFAVITAGIGILFKVHCRAPIHGLPVRLRVDGGYCGTLMTPMAANSTSCPRRSSASSRTRTA